MTLTGPSFSIFRKIMPQNDQQTYFKNFRPWKNFSYDTHDDFQDFPCKIKGFPCQAALEEAWMGGQSKENL